MTKEQEMAAPEAEETLVVIPIVPGKSEGWRRAMQEIAGSRQEDFELAQERWGISSVSVYTASTRLGQVAVIRLQTNNSLIDLQLQIAASEEPFDRWLKEQFRVYHGIDLDGPAGGKEAERIIP
jgi:hypothetical protein